MTTLGTRARHFRKSFLLDTRREMTHCATPGRPIQFYSNEPRGAVKSKRVGRKVNGEGLQFPRRTSQSCHHVVKGACDIVHHTPLTFFMEIAEQ